MRRNVNLPDASGMIQRVANGLLDTPPLQRLFYLSFESDWIIDIESRAIDHLPVLLRHSPLVRSPHRRRYRFTKLSRFRTLSVAGLRATDSLDMLVSTMNKNFEQTTRRSVVVRNVATVSLDDLMTK